MAPDLREQFRENAEERAAEDLLRAKAEASASCQQKERPHSGKEQRAA